VLTLVLPGVVAAVAGGVLIAAGFLISWPILNVLVGAAFPLVLLAGLLFAMIVILLIASSTLLYPAIAVEDADPFDAISRAFGYVIGRPWRWIFYNTVALVYGALTYLVMTFVVFLSIAAVYYCMRIGAMDKGDFNAILPPPNADQLFYKPDWSGSEGTAAFTAILVWGWVSLMISLLAAYAVSFGISASTWVYLLLRRSADGNELSDIYTIEVPASESEE